MDPDAANFLIALQLLNSQFARFDPSKPLSSSGSDSDSQDERESNANPTPEDSASSEVTRARAISIADIDATGDDYLDPEKTASSDLIFNINHITPDQIFKTDDPVYQEEGTSKATPRKSDNMYREKAKEMLDGDKWVSTGLLPTQLSSPEEVFCPWEMVCKYPKNFVGKKSGEKVAPLWTKEGLVDDFSWDFYYMYNPYRLDDKDPVLFVPTYQFDHFLDVVNNKLGTYLTIPGGGSGERFQVIFGEMPLRPRYLGRTTSMDDFDDLVDEFPDPHPKDDLEKLDKEDKETLMALFTNVVKWGAIDKTKAKKQNSLKRIRNHQTWGRSVKRVQRYLGLRERNRSGTRVDPESLDVNQPMTSMPEGAPLIIAIDLEAWERDQTVITEVGLGILDTRDLIGVAPGDGGQNWFKLVKGRHIRVRENTWVKNTDFVQGCPDNFNFGESEFVSLVDVAKHLRDLIDDATFPATDDRRKVVLVFHDKSGDLKYLKTVRYDPYCAANLEDIIDTREMDQFVTRSNNQAGLSLVLSRLGIEYSYLHNAGNDAVYTLYAMIGLAVKKRIASIEKRAGKRDNDDNDHIPWAEFHEKDGWTSGEDTDGGDSVPLFAPQHDTKGLDDDSDIPGICKSSKDLEDSNVGQSSEGLKDSGVGHPSHGHAHSAYLDDDDDFYSDTDDGNLSNGHDDTDAGQSSKTKAE